MHPMGRRKDMNTVFFMLEVTNRMPFILESGVFIEKIVGNAVLVEKYIRSMKHINLRHQMVKAKHVEATHTETTACIKSARMNRHALVTRDIQLTGGIQLIRSNLACHST
ncbi:hypothetical protein LWI29_003857 [Acer saccharum]|uniref:Uncharacterized protein n=1 Tax=Acer saccharum TaxID=4024 RepID=A0AA39RCA5_ACESA|nr:hypothetical protein LWI29_003857 [Acer saccharum]